MICSPLAGPPIPHCSRVRTRRYLHPIREERCAGVIRRSDPQPAIPSAAAAAAPVDGWRGNESSPQPSAELQSGPTWLESIPLTALTAQPGPEGRRTSRSPRQHRLLASQDDVHAHCFHSPQNQKPEASRETILCSLFVVLIKNNELQ